jgi:hypothetical protein
MYKHMKKILIAGLCTIAALPLAAQEEEPVSDPMARECVDLRQVRRTEVVDDRNILFYMRGNLVYHNILPRQCGGLAREDRFSYRVAASRLCRMDDIRVLYNDPNGLREGNHCGLGLFHEITKEDAKAFKEDLQRRPEAAPLPMPEPQEVDDQDDESADPESR